MAKYRVTVQEVIEYRIDVKADSEDDAKSAAIEKVVQGAAEVDLLACTEREAVEIETV